MNWQRTRTWATRIAVGYIMVLSAIAATLGVGVMVASAAGYCR